MKNQKGLSMIVIVIIIAVVILAVCAGVGFLVGMNNQKKAKELQEQANMQAYEQEKIKENKQKNEIASTVGNDKVEELVFTKDFLESGNVYGNVEYIEDSKEKTTILSITGIADNAITETNYVSTKNRWYKKIDLTKYNTLEFYARNAQDNGDLLICVDNTIIKKIRYTDMSTAWNKYTVDVSKYQGVFTLAIAGGYSDNTGSENSCTQYRNIKLK